MTTDRTIHEIKEEYGRQSAEIVNGYQAAITEIAAEGPSEASVPHLEHLNRAQVNNIMLEQKMERAQERYREDLERWLARHDRYRAGLSARAEVLWERLFNVGDSTALGLASAADEAGLMRMLRHAAKAGNKDLARAVFVVAEEEGRGDLMARFFDEVDGEARELYQEWKEIPAPEDLEHQRQSIERIIRPPTPERLMAPWASLAIG
jgi:hypothetical protein